MHNTHTHTPLSFLCLLTLITSLMDAAATLVDSPCAPAPVIFVSLRPPLLIVPFDAHLNELYCCTATLYLGQRYDSFSLFQLSNLVSPVRAWWSRSCCRHILISATRTTPRFDSDSVPLCQSPPLLCLLSFPQPYPFCGSYGSFVFKPPLVC